MNLRKFICFFIIVIFIIVNSGCWNYREIETFGIAVGIAIDKNEDDQYEITVEIINPSGEGKETKMVPVVLSMTGESVFDAVRNIIVRTGKKLYWSHAKVVVISEKIAEEGILDIIDWIHRDAEIRSDMWVLIERGHSAKDILNGNPKLDKIVSFHLDDMLKAEGKVATFMSVKLWELIKKLAGEGVCPILPTVNIIKEKEKLIPQIFGTAIMKEAKMIGWLCGNDTKNLFWIIKKGKAGFLVVLKNAINTNTDVTLEIFNSSTKIEPIYENGQLTIDISVRSQMGIAVLSDNNLQFYKKENVTKLEQELTLYLEKKVKNQIKILQKEYKCDILGFAQSVKIKYPNLWKTIRKDWDEIFTDLTTRVKFDVVIKESALPYKPLKVED